MAELGSSLRLEMAELGASLRLEIATLGGDLRAEIRGGGRSLLLSLVGLQLSAAGLVVAVSRLV